MITRTHFKIKPDMGNSLLIYARVKKIHGVLARQNCAEETAQYTIALRFRPLHNLFHP